jgi:AraC-like DNA-binding protein
VRIEKSKALLRHDALRISDIAGAAGFEDQSYFTKVFKRMVGVTPNRYRDMLRQK